MRRLNNWNIKRFSLSGKTRVFSSEDVEFSKELADHEDLEALERARKADARQQP